MVEIKTPDSQLRVPPERLGEISESADNPRIPRGSIISVGVFVIVGAALSAFGGSSLPALHTVLDTAMFVLSSVLAILLWDMGERLNRPFTKSLALAFGATALLEVVHVLVSIEWAGPLAWISSLSEDLRPHTWPPAAVVLPAGIIAALWLQVRRRRNVLWYGVVLAAGAGAVYFAYQFPSPYSPPGLLGVTRPTLLPASLLWAVTAWACWKYRTADRALPTLALSAAAIFAGSLVMLYSRAPHDAAAMAAHLAKVSGYLALLFSLMHMASLDLLERDRTERKLAELNRELHERAREQAAQLTTEMAERRKSLELLQVITDNTSAVVYAKDLEGRYLMVNRRYCEIFGVDGAAMVGKTDHNLFAKEVADAFRAMDQRVAAAGGPLTEEEQAPQDDGIHDYISVKAPLRDENGRTYAVFGISTDITELKRAQQALTESEQRAGLIIETAIDAVIGIDAAGAVNEWSPQAVNTFGWTCEEALGRSLAELIVPERYRAAHKRGLIRYLATGKARVLNQRIEMTALHRDGHELPVELSIAALHSGGGAVAFSAFARDISERKAAEAKLKAQLERMDLLDRITRAIAEREDLDSIFQIAVRSIEDQLPADFACLCLYDRAERVLNVAHVGVKSASLALSLAMPERARVEIDENGLSRCVGGHLVHEPDVSASPFPFPQRLARGGLHSFVAAPLQVESQVFGTLIVARREASAFSSGECEFLRQLSEHVALASHQAQVYAALQQAYDDLRQTQDAVLQQERLRALGRMASGVAHDINNALSPISLFTESILATDPTLSDASRAKLEIMQRAIDDAALTVSRMKDFYRQRPSDLALAPVSTDAIIQQTVEFTQARWRDMAQERGVFYEVKTDLAQDAPAILGVESELREALVNLVFNAIDAMPDGGTITLSSRRVATAAGERVAIEVVDAGIGMDETTRQRCLEPFFTTKGERGTGLGLAMVYGAMRRHGGEFEIESAPGVGTLIRLLFDAAPALDAGGAPQASASSSPLQQLRLLIIDDDPILLRSLREVLEGDAHVVVAAANGAGGLEAFERAKADGHAFDAIITDLGMPKMDGRRVAAAIKERSPETPVLLLTGWGERLMAQEERVAHVDRILSKPPKLRDIRVALAELIAQTPPQSAS